MNNLKEIKDYKILDILGAGAHGLVYRAINKRNGQLVAIKHIQRDIHNSKQAQSEKSIRNELRFLRQTSHDNIIRIVDFIEQPQNLMIVLEFMEGGALNQIIDKTGPLDEEVTKSVISQLLGSLKYLHSKTIVHRDIKVMFLCVFVVYSSREMTRRARTFCSGKREKSS